MCPPYMIIEHLIGNHLTRLTVFIFKTFSILVEPGWGLSSAALLAIAPNFVVLIHPIGPEARVRPPINKILCPFMLKMLDKAGLSAYMA